MEPAGHAGRRPLVAACPGDRAGGSPRPPSHPGTLATGTGQPSQEAAPADRLDDVDATACAMQQAMLIDARGWLALGVRARGVLHVGAHEGEEGAFYHRQGWGPVIWVEMLPEKAADLRARLAGGGDQVIEAACWDADGELITLNRASDEVLVPAGAAGTPERTSRGELCTGRAVVGAIAFRSWFENRSVRSTSCSHIGRSRL